jgi:cytochrome c biogenesis protein CcdA
MKRFLPIIAFFCILVPTVFSSTTNPKVEVYVTYSTCSTCPDDPLQKQFEDYLWELWYLWGSNVEVLKIDEIPELESVLKNLYKKMGIPNYLPSRFTLAVIIDEKHVFINHVPVEMIHDWLSNPSIEDKNIIVYKDESKGIYKIIDNGMITEYDIEGYISETTSGANLNILNWSTFSILAISGFLDGINPCAFSVMIFMITLFFTREYAAKPSRKNEYTVLLFGFTYIMAVYLTYLAIGLTLRKIIDIIPFPHLASQIGAIVLIIAGIIKLKDHFRPNIGISLKLSKFARVKIATSKASTLPVTFAMGVLVAIFEFPCTGGIYVAILSTLATRTTFLKGVLYLLIYNFAFIFPLIVILIISVSTRFTNFSFREWQQQRIGQIELFESLIYISFGVFLLFLSYF